VASLPLVLLGGCTPSEPASPSLVLFIEVDTLRADFLGAHADSDAGAIPAHTPFLDGLAAESLVFDAAHATAPWTQPSLASTLTGKWPWQHGVTRLLAPLPDGHRTLAEAFDAGGWSTAGVMTNFLIKEEAGYARGFDLWSEDLATGHEGTSAEAAVDELLASYDTLAAASDAPVFLFGFFFEPHWRYEPTDATAALAVTRYRELKELRAALAAGELDAADLAGLRALYAGEVERIDHALARLAAGLRERGVWDDAVVIFTADHGEELGESTWGRAPWVGHTVDLSETLTRVPLWIKAPGLEPEREVRPVSGIDLGATALGLAGLEPSLGEGHSLLTAPARERLFLHVDFEPALVQPGSERKRSLMWGVIDTKLRRKWVVDHRAPGGPVGLEFDLAADPHELAPLAPNPITPTLQTRLGLVPAPLDGRRGEEPSQP
jgi:arylsulfatase